MRHWFLIVMIALLPVRGWALGTMTGQMPPVHAAVTATSIAQGTPAQAAGGGSSKAGHHKPAVMMADCEQHAGASGQAASSHAQAEDSATDSTGATADCHSCTSCQICHTVAATAAADLPALTFSSHALPSLAGARFASAQPAPGLKPPIS